MEQKSGVEKYWGNIFFWERGKKKKQQLLCSVSINNVCKIIFTK